MVVVSVGDEMSLGIHPEPAADPQHARNVRTVQVHVQQSHLIASKGQTQGQIDGHAGLAHAALAAHDQEFVPDVPELFLKMGFVFSCLVMMLGATLGALAGLTGAHVKPLLVEIRFCLSSHQIMCQGGNAATAALKQVGKGPMGTI
jgi:hypothetical protein